MCGICGTTEAADGGVVRAMNATLVHRGPDDEGIYVDGDAGVALGARRLSVVDVEGGHQPLSNEDRTVWAALNGEIYNFPSLRGRLLAKGHRLTTRTDTEVLVHLYEDYGDALVHALEGMYAFAIWDAPRRRLLLVRDRFGEKPLFYTHRSGVLTFASELTALLGRGTTSQLDPEVFDAYFVHGYVPGGRTFVQGVRQLEPGRLLVWEPGAQGPRIERYWTPPPPVVNGRAAHDELVSEAGDILDRSVRSRLISDVPLGIFLSGGVDSSLVAAIAARHSSVAVKTFSVGYDTGGVNETPRARHVANAIGAEHHELVLTSDSVGELVPRAIAELDQPLADAAFVPLRALAGEARRLVTVAVGGEGADELFGGYPRYRWLDRAQRLPRWITRRVPQAVVPRFGRAARLEHLVAPAPLLERNLAWMAAGRPAWRQTLYGPRLRELLGAGHENHVPATVVELAARGETVASLMQLDQLRWLPDDVLTKADRATMRASLEFRTPFLNRELAEFAATVPARRHIGDGGKSVLRALHARTLPELRNGVAKTAFRAPTAEWLRGPLAPAIESHVRESRLYDEGWFERRPVRALLDEHRQGDRDHSAVLWPLFVLGTWLDTRSGLDA